MSPQPGHDPVPSPEDAELMALVACDDEGAFRVLVERHQNLVYGTITKMLGDPIEAEDIAQQVFLRVHRAAKTYQHTAQFKTWLFTIVRNLVMNEYRRRNRAWLQPLPSQDDEDENTGHSAELADKTTKTPAQHALDRELMTAVDQAILDLPEQQRLAVILRRYDEFSYEEIAAILKTSVPSTKSLLFRARETLRDALQSYLDQT